VKEVCGVMSSAVQSYSSMELRVVCADLRTCDTDEAEPLASAYKSQPVSHSKLVYRSFCFIVNIRLLRCKHRYLNNKKTRLLIPRTTPC
jgi:hypothetical protein